MITARKPTLRFKGSGEHLRLRVAPAPDPLGTLRECCRASVALEKALGEAVSGAIAAGHTWAEVSQTLGVDAEAPEDVLEAYDASRRWMRSRFWGLEGEEGS